MASRRSYSWSSVRLSICGTYLDPVEVTAALGIEPDDSAKKGDLYGPAHNRMCKQGVWSLIGRPSTSRIETQMADIIERLGPSKARLREFVRENNHVREVSLDIGYSPREDLAIACFTLQSALVKEYVSLGIDIEISFYLPLQYMAK